MSALKSSDEQLDNNQRGTADSKSPEMQAPGLASAALLSRKIQRRAIQRKGDGAAAGAAGGGVEKKPEPAKDEAAPGAGPGAAADHWTPTDEATIATAITTLGVMGAFQAVKVRPLVEGLAPADYTAFRALLDAASSVYVRAFLFKALAASHTVAEIAPFAAAINNKDQVWLISNCTGGDALQQGTGTKQAYRMTCGVTTVQTIRAEYDPIYGLKLHTENPDLGKVDENDPTKFSPNAAKEQKTMQEDGSHPGYSAGLAEPRSKATNAGGRWVEDWLNSLSASTGMVFTLQKDPTGPQAVTLLAQYVGQGMMTPIVIGGAPQGYSHYNLVMNMRTAAPKPPEPGPAPVPVPQPAKAHPLVHRGSAGDDVKECQTKLNAKGATPPLAVDGLFGPLTEHAARDFQGKNGLDADGKVGPKTWAKLDEVTPEVKKVDVPPVAGPPKREFQFHDPGAGATVWMTEDQISTGTMAPGWPMVTAIDIPSAAPAKAPAAKPPAAK